MSLRSTCNALSSLLMTIFFGLSLPGLAQNCVATDPTIGRVNPTGDMLSPTVTTYCAGGSIGVFFGDFSPNCSQLTPYNVGRQYVLEISNDGFVSSTTLIVSNFPFGGGNGQIATGSFSGVMPANVPPGSGYSIRLRATSPVRSGAVFGSTITILAPPVQPDFGAMLTVVQNGALTLTNTAACSGTLMWGRTNGDMATGTGSISVPTAQLGVVSYSAVCQTVACKSPITTVSVTVVTPPLPPPTNLSLTSGTLTCAQTSLTLTATATDGASFSLSNGQPGSPTINTTGLFTVNAPGTYTLTVANATGQTAFTTATIGTDTSLPNLTINPASGTLTCTQTSLTLTATSSATALRWTGNVMSNSLVVNTSGTYSVTATYQNGCSSMASVSVGQNTTAPTAGLLASNNTLSCTRTTVTLTASGGSGLPGGTYAFTGTGIVASSGNSATVNQANTFTVTVTGTNGCTATQTAIITSNTVAITPTLVANPNAILTCTQTSLTLTGGGGSGGDLYSFGGPTPVSQAGNVLVVNTAGTYSVTVTNPASGCFSATTLQVSQTNAGLITVALTTPNTNLTTTAPTALLTATPGAGTYRFVGPGLNQTGPNNTATGAQAGVFSVTAGLGICATTASITLTGSGGPAPAPTPFVVVRGVLSCATPLVQIDVTGGDEFLFRGLDNIGDGIVSSFDGSYREVLNAAYGLRRTPIPTSGWAIVYKPGTYTITVRNGNSAPTQVQVVVTGVACL